MKATIKAIDNGPLVLESDDNHSIIYFQDKPITSGNPAYLCRCGHSKTKPFCDGAHSDVQFQSKREIESEVIQEYLGKSLDITFNRSICAGAANCVAQLPSVFISGSSENWINPNNASPNDIIATIQACPSGALSYKQGNHTLIDSRETAKVTIIKDGPYNVEAVNYDFKPMPKNFSTSKYTLCRCGLSRNKPYCDYSHAENNWSDEA